MDRVDHRPWALPRVPWVMRMRWERLLFVHYAVDADALNRVLPAGMQVDTFAGKAWLGIVPFVMSGVRPRGLPRAMAFRSFGELNVRTYVTVKGKPGVVFFSLDCEHGLTVRAARLGYALPYFHAKMLMREHADGVVRYTSERRDAQGGEARFAASYGACVGSPVREPVPGTLEHFLTERYCLYTLDRRGRIWRGEIHHWPWPLREGWVAFDEPAQSMVDWLRVELPEQEPVVHFAESLDVVAWWPSRA